jgi:hypothetical protein
MLKQLFFISILLFFSVITKAQLYVTNGEIVTVSTSGDLNLQEDLNNNGTITNLTLGGNNVQNILGTGTINTLIVNKSGGTATGTAGMQTITSLLTPTAGTLAAAGYITLQSNHTATAYATSGAATISGLNIQHYLTSNQRGWRLIGSPFTTGVTLANLATASNIDITYGSVGANGYGGTSAPSAETYVPATNTWTTYIVSSNTWNANSSIALYIRGIKGEGIPGSGTGWLSGLNYVTPSTVTLQAQGTLNVAEALFSVSANKPNIIANPFAAPISLNAVLNANTGFSSTIGYYDPTLSSTGVTTKAGGYSTSIPSSSDIIIPPMGSFVITSTGGTNFTVPSSAINTSATPTLGVLGLGGNKPSVISLSIISDTIFYDAFTLRFDATATAATGDKYDFIKMANQNLDLYSISSDIKELAYDNRSAGLAEQIIPIGIRSDLQKCFTINAINNANVNALLRDNLLHKDIPLIGNDNYSFNITSDSASQGNNRFQIILNAKASITSINPSIENFTAEILGNVTGSNTITVKIMGSKGPVNIRATDMAGRNLSITQSGDGIQKVQLGNIRSGMLLLQFSDGKSTITKKIIKF